MRIGTGTDSTGPVTWKDVFARLDLLRLVPLRESEHCPQTSPCPRKAHSTPTPSSRSGRSAGPRPTRSAPAAATTPARASTCSTCSRTRPATCTWATPRATRYVDVVARFWRHHGYNVLQPDRLGLLRPARRERGDQARCRSARVDLREHRAAQEELPRVRLVVRLVADPAHERPRVLPVEPVAVPAPVREGPRLPQGQPGQLVPERPDRARQRAGRRRALRALRRRGRQEEAHPVVLQDHRLRRPPARRPEPARGLLAVEGHPDAAQLDRPLDRRRRRVRDRGPRRAGHGLHDAPRHAVRRDVHRRRPRLRPRGRARRGRGRRGADALPDLPRAGRRSRPRSSGRAPTARRPACSSAATRSTRSTASACRSGRPTTCSPTTATAPSWPCPRTTSATSTSRARSICLCASSSTRPRRSPARSRSSSSTSTACRSIRARTRHPSPISTRRARASPSPAMAG